MEKVMLCFLVQNGHSLTILDSLQYIMIDIWALKSLLECSALKFINREVLLV